MVLASMELFSAVADTVQPSLYFFFPLHWHISYVSKSAAWEINNLQELRILGPPTRFRKRPVPTSETSQWGNNKRSDKEVKTVVGHNRPKAAVTRMGATGAQTVPGEDNEAE